MFIPMIKEFSMFGWQIQRYESYVSRLHEEIREWMSPGEMVIPANRILDPDASDSVIGILRNKIEQDMQRFHSKDTTVVKANRIALTSHLNLKVVVPLPFRTTLSQHLCFSRMMNWIRSWRTWRFDTRSQRKMKWSFGLKISYSVGLCRI